MFTNPIKTHLTCFDSFDTFFAHSNTETFLQTTVLALVAVMLVDLTFSIWSAQRKPKTRHLKNKKYLIFMVPDSKLEILEKASNKWVSYKEEKFTYPPPFSLCLFLSHSLSSWPLWWVNCVAWLKSYQGCDLCKSSALYALVCCLLQQDEVFQYFIRNPFKHNRAKTTELVHYYVEEIAIHRYRWE